MNLILQPFTIQIRLKLTNYKIHVKQSYLDSKTEYLEITCGKKSLTLASNRPAFRAMGLTKRKPKFEVLEHSENIQIWNMGALNAIIDEVCKEIASQEKSQLK
ncbi:MAG TPA: hypothetical protein PLP23_09235 [Panacibacter sp.]|nr:hypothetical protein [Panacibacter sp.]